MPTASHNVRKIRRIKRERTLAFRALNKLNFQFEQVRAYAASLKKSLEEKDLKGSLTITKIDEPSPEEVEHNVPGGEVVEGA